MLCVICGFIYIHSNSLVYFYFGIPLLLYCCIFVVIFAHHLYQITSAFSYQYLIINTLIVIGIGHQLYL